MAILKDEYQKFLEDIEKNIKDPDDLLYIKQRVAAFLDIVLTQMDYLIDYKEDKMAKLEQTQKELNSKLSKMQEVIDNIEKDIYSEDGFDFEIVCPYCNYEFVIDMDENKTEIQCPECQNIIELDWSGNLDDDAENGCNGDCHGCNGCDDQENDEDNQDNEDDM